ncbi:5'-nucleotidase C-terminal domain-containing protein [Breznakiella homolactica]|uniref:5'-nucleotidase C-terminal domain-containing protein n=1 Tax=Breznakiella homolactica TaxID=2798577 RepID=A0A7T7XRK8_9SPIR|nr:5'-nucleotidase C-terminal domain-containing protein [Breznakiella homolactica]QQO11152.1 5'-nucleotidase C-terminal domain-containing protein [Breznakiella homolactica]
MKRKWMIPARESLFKMSLILMLGILFLAGSPLALASGSAEEITVYHTNDVHGSVIGTEKTCVGMEYIGGIKMATPNSLLLDAGDILDGTMAANRDEGRSIVRMMNSAGYDMMTLGNHEFGKGQVQLLEILQQADFPVMGANIAATGESRDSENLVNFLTPYKIFEVAGKKIAVFGISTPETLTKSNPARLKGLTFTDVAAAAKRSVDTIRAEHGKMDAVICVAHCGMDNSSDDENKASAVMSLLNEGDIDLIIDGHAHQELMGSGAMYEKGAMIVSTGTALKYLGKVTISFSRNGAKTLTSSYIDAADARANYRPRPSTKELVDEMSSYLAEASGTVIGKFRNGMYGGEVYGERVSRKGESNMASFVTDAKLWQTRNYFEGTEYLDPSKYVIIGYNGGGGIRASHPAGEITIGSVFKVLPFDQGTVYIALPASDLYKMIENGVSKIAGQDGQTGYVQGADGRFFNASGMRFEYDISETAQVLDEINTSPTFGQVTVPGRRVKNIYLDCDNGARLSEDDPRKIVLGVLSFEMSGGDGYFLLTDYQNKIIGEDISNTQATIRYIQYLMTLPENRDGIAYPLNQGRCTILGSAYKNSSWDFKGTVAASPGASSDSIMKLSGYDMQKEGARPVAGVQYRVTLNGKETGSVTTDSSGSFTLNSLPNGPAELRLTGHGRVFETCIDNFAGINNLVFIEAAGHP